MKHVYSCILHDEVWPGTLAVMERLKQAKLSLMPQNRPKSVKAADAAAAAAGVAPVFIAGASICMAAPVPSFVLY